MSILRKPNAFEERIIANVPTIRLVTECLSSGCQSYSRKELNDLPLLKQGTP